MSATHLAKWGNSLAVRIPKDVVESAKLREGDSVSVRVSSSGEITIRAARPVYSLDELVTGITAKNRHTETDWGAAVGEESW